MYKIPDSSQRPRPSVNLGATGGGGTSFQSPVVTLSDVDDYKEKPGQVGGSLQLFPFRREAQQVTRRTSVAVSQRRFLECGSEVMCVRYTQDGKFIAAGLSNGNIKLFNSETGELAYTLSYDDTGSKKMPCTSINFPRPAQPDSQKPEHSHILTATYACGSIRQWHYTSPGGTAPLQNMEEERQTLVATYSPHQHHHFLTAGADPSIHLYDMTTQQRVMTMKASVSNISMDGHRTRVFSLSYHKAQPHVFVSGGWDDTVHFWDDRQSHSIRKFFGPHVCGDGVDIDPIHNHILTASWRKENALQVWDFNNAKLIKSVPRDVLHEGLLYTGMWYQKNFMLCGGCDKNMVRLIDRGTFNTVGELTELPAAVYCLDFNEQQIIAGTSTQVWRVKFVKI